MQRTFKIYLETTRQQRQQRRNKIINSRQSASFEKRLKKDANFASMKNTTSYLRNSISSSDGTNSYQVSHIKKHLLCNYKEIPPETSVHEHI